MLVDALQRYEIERQAATAAATPVTSPSDKPNCLCGAPAQMLTVKKEGPQRGRKFWKCVQRQFEFFQWIGIDADTMSVNDFILDDRKYASVDPRAQEGSCSRSRRRRWRIRSRWIAMAQCEAKKWRLVDFDENKDDSAQERRYSRWKKTMR